MSPRPFALHLALAMSALMGSKIGLQRWSDDWPNWMGPSTAPDRARRENLAARLGRFDPEAGERALDDAVFATQAALARGIAAYRRHPYYRPAEQAAVIWERGTTQLLDHGGEGGVPVLFVPSLINRGWILDLHPGQGMLSWLAAHGVHPYRIEWGAPGEQERSFDVAGYVASRLEPALEVVSAGAGRPTMLAGYCMGGLLAIAAAVKRPELVRALLLLASPWDFHAEGAARGAALAGIYRTSKPALGVLRELPVDIIQGLFAMHDPIVALRKFQRFAELDPNSAQAQAFVALEDWVNDGVPLSLPVAEEAFLSWYELNSPGRGAWRVGGTVVDPAMLAMPSLVVVPGADKIVPPGSASAILQKLRHPTRLDPDSGHIGMVVGRNAKSTLWEPLAEWIRARGLHGG